MSRNNILETNFFNRDAQVVAKELLGKVICRKYKDIWLSVRIIETEAYYLNEKGSHASLGYTEKRKALFMKPGTIYMYHSRGGASMNVSTRGDGNAVLFKSGYPYIDGSTDPLMIETMQLLNPPRSETRRPTEKLCSGQALLCKSLGLSINEWDKKEFDPKKLYITDVGYTPEKIVQARRLGISKGRDEHLMYRFIDYRYAPFVTKNVLNQKSMKEGTDYSILLNS